MIDRDQALRDAFSLLQAGNFAEARDRLQAFTSDPSCALIEALGRAGAGDVPGGARALAAIAQANPTAQHPALDLADLMQQHGQDPRPHLRAALDIMPDHPTILTAFGGACAERGPLDHAITAFRRVADNRPSDPAAWSNLGKALAAMGRFEEASTVFAQAVALPGVTPQIRLNQAVATLKSGALAIGWLQFRARHDLPGRPPPPPGPELRSLDGVDGRTVLLVHHEGFGDTLQFIRYAPLLAARGARVVALVPPELLRLLTHNGLDAVTTAPAYDTWCTIPDLPGLFAPTLDNATHDIPAALPYLHPDPALVAYWKARLPPRTHGRRRVGLVWAGAARSHDPAAYATDRLRSLLPTQLAPLLALPGTDWISLQHGAAAPAGVFDPMPAVRDFADTAAILASLDSLVSVDTAVLHLAAALGRPVVLLDRFDNCWRWLSGRVDSPWYPDVIQIIRQPSPGDWDSVLATAAHMLRA